MRKNSRGIFIVLLVMILVLSGLLILRRYSSADAEMYRNNWNITIPKNLKRQYYTSSFGGGAHDGESYAIYGLKDEYTWEDASVLEGVSSRKNPEMQNEVVTIIKSLKADTKNYPDFSHDYQWKILYSGSDRLYILYDTKLSCLYFVQYML